VRKEVPKDLRYKSYIVKRGQLMSEHSQARKRMQDWLKKNPLGGVGEEVLAFQLT
jgi:hypothetical protein